MNNRADVSIIIPAYNVNQFIQQAVESALAQTGVTTEIIVVDDGSLIPVKNELPESVINKIKLIRTRNSGVAKARNVGIGSATSDFICLLDGDDYLHPSHCMLALSSLSKLKPNTIYIPDGFMVGSVDSQTGRLPGGKLPNSLIGDSFAREGEINFENFIKGGSTISSWCVFPKAAFGQVKGYREDLSRCEDFHLHAKLLLSGFRYHYSHTPTYYYRRHDESLTIKAQDVLVEYRIRALKALLDECLSGEHKIQVANQISQAENEFSMISFKIAISHRNFKAARQSLKNVDISLINKFPSKAKWMSIKMLLFAFNN